MAEPDRPSVHQHFVVTEVRRRHVLDVQLLARRPQHGGAHGYLRGSLHDTDGAGRAIDLDQVTGGDDVGRHRRAHDCRHPVLAGDDRGVGQRSAAVAHARRRSWRTPASSSATSPRRRGSRQARCGAVRRHRGAPERVHARRRRTPPTPESTSSVCPAADRLEEVVAHPEDPAQHGVVDVVGDRAEHLGQVGPPGDPLVVEVPALGDHSGERRPGPFAARDGRELRTEQEQPVGRVAAPSDGGQGERRPSQREVGAQVDVVVVLLVPPGEVGRRAAGQGLVELGPFGARQLAAGAARWPRCARRPTARVPSRSRGRRASGGTS